MLKLNGFEQNSQLRELSLKPNCFYDFMIDDFK